MEDKRREEKSETNSSLEQQSTCQDHFPVGVGSHNSPFEPAFLNLLTVPSQLSIIHQLLENMVALETESQGGLPKAGGALKTCKNAKTLNLQHQ